MKLDKIKFAQLAAFCAGDFSKVGRKHYRHTSGMEIKFDAAKSGWMANGHIWPSLRAASLEVAGVAERVA